MTEPKHSYTMPDGRAFCLVSIQEFVDDGRFVLVPRCAAPLFADEVDHSAELSFSVSLVEVDCRFFACVGPYSESLHDELDELLVAKFIARDADEGNFPVTTFHEDETLDEVLDSLLFIPELRSVETIYVALRDCGGYRMKEVDSSMRRFA